MSAESGSATAQLLDVAKEALERFHEVRVDDDGALSFRHGEVPCALQGVELSEGLEVLSLTCVVAWDLPAESDIPLRLAERAGQGLFGTLGAIRTDRGWDVTLRYVFPAAGLGVEAMGTLLMLVVSNASTLRTELLG
ncbi:MAG TPA: hypothetical protein VK735_36765 [Pseudonocardia sp.]|jgi:hypothetical protein|uniref:hypothetical protein n=1 Tax=Pseudonocardia sp. TaxID=60912 RepID=UPI002C2BFF8A|nr:hypothetical protein [Pseudonocardia sp.]HTF53031.1 hypothetical protein [Pseudonocardia sp.]